MKNIIIFIFVLSQTFFAVAQSDLEFSEYLGTNALGEHYFGPKTVFPQNKISEDFGPRTPYDKHFHGGVDYNSRGFGDQDIKDLLHSLEPGQGIVQSDDGVVQNAKSKWITISGAHNVRYIHIFEKGVIVL